MLPNLKWSMGKTSIGMGFNPKVYKCTCHHNIMAVNVLDVGTHPSNYHTVILYNLSDMPYSIVVFEYHSVNHTGP